MKTSNIKNRIEVFDKRFNNTAADSRAFEIVLKSGILADMFLSYLNFEFETINDFKDRMTSFAITSMNQIYKPYGRIVRDESIIHDYIDHLVDSLVESA